MEYWLVEESVNISFKEKVVSSRKACNVYLKVVGEYNVFSGNNICVCGTIYCMKGVFPVLPNFLCSVPEFLMMEDIHIRPLILALID